MAIRGQGRRGGGRGGRKRREERKETTSLPSPSLSNPTMHKGGGGVLIPTASIL